eukprot:scaffold96117_cov20-Tisochrysis_lutea.AAC.2
MNERVSSVHTRTPHTHLHARTHAQAITADGMHSITSNFVAVAKELASALPTVELTAQLARGEGPLASHPDGAPDSLSETDTADVDEESRTSDDADLSSQEDEGEEPCENE